MVRASLRGCFCCDHARTQQLREAQQLTHGAQHPAHPTDAPSPCRPKRQAAPVSPVQTAARRPHAHCPLVPARLHAARPTLSAHDTGAAATTAAPTPAWRPCRPRQVGSPRPGWGGGETGQGTGGVWGPAPWGNGPAWDCLAAEQLGLNLGHLGNGNIALQEQASSCIQ